MSSVESFALVPSTVPPKATIFAAASSVNVFAAPPSANVTFPVYVWLPAVVTFPPNELVPLTFSAAKLVVPPTVPAKTTFDTSPEAPILSESTPSTVRSNVISCAVVPLLAVSVSLAPNTTGPVYVCNPVVKTFPLNVIAPVVAGVAIRESSVKAPEEPSKIFPLLAVSVRFAPDTGVMPPPARSMLPLSDWMV